MKLAFTGPSRFTTELVEAIENYYEADPVYVVANCQDRIRRAVDECEGLILAGGADLHPATYRGSVMNNMGLKSFDIARDRREAFAFKYALSTEKPVLGICRGHQLIGVTLGLAIHQDISGSKVCHSPEAARISLEKTEPAHAVEIDGEFAGTDRPQHWWVNSFHHQAISTKIPPQAISRVRVLGKCDKYIELMGCPRGAWLSCQWHPEWDWRENEHSTCIFRKFSEMLSLKGAFA